MSLNTGVGIQLIIFGGPNSRFEMSAVMYNGVPHIHLVNLRDGRAMDLTKDEARVLAESLVTYFRFDDKTIR